MTKPECHCVVGSQLPSMPTSQHASEHTRLEPAPEHAEPVLHILGVGRDVLVLLCGELRSRTGMMGRRTSSLPATARGAAALGALDGTYLVWRDVRLRKLECARNAKLRASLEMDPET